MSLIWRDQFMILCVLWSDIWLWWWIHSCLDQKHERLPPNQDRPLHRHCRCCCQLDSSLSAGAIESAWPTGKILLRSSEYFLPSKGKKGKRPNRRQEVGRKKRIFNAWTSFHFLDSIRIDSSFFVDRNPTFRFPVATVIESSQSWASHKSDWLALGKLFRAWHALRQVEETHLIDRGRQKLRLAWLFKNGFEFEFYLYFTHTTDDFRFVFGVFVFVF